MIVNNTIAGNVGGGVDMNANLDDATGNTIAGVVVRNTLFWDNTYDVAAYGVPAPAVDHSLTTQAGYAGVNGNVAGDPAFVDATAGDLRLGPGSAAIDAGSSTGAPVRDRACRVRADDPAVANTGTGTRAWFDIGAFEHLGGPPACVAKLTVVVRGAGTVETTPGVIVCRATCTASVAVGSRLVVRALPDSGMLFTGWGGECDRRGDCALTVVSDIRVIADFAAVPDADGAAAPRPIASGSAR